MADNVALYNCDWQLFANEPAGTLMALKDGMLLRCSDLDWVARFQNDAAAIAALEKAGFKKRQKYWAHGEIALPAYEKRVGAMNEPQTPAEWQEAVDGAAGALALDAARQYGLVTGGPGVNVERCAEILERGKALGVEPAADAVETFCRSLKAGESAMSVPAASLGQYKRWARVKKCARCGRRHVKFGAEVNCFERPKK